MTDPLFYLLAIAMFAVVLVLTLGLGGFAKGGAFNKKYGNKMMQLRILFQAIAVAIIVGLVALGGMR